MTLVDIILKINTSVPGFHAHTHIERHRSPCRAEKRDIDDDDIDKILQGGWGLFPYLNVVHSFEDGREVPFVLIPLNTIEENDWQFFKTWFPTTSETKGKEND